MSARHGIDWTTYDDPARAARWIDHETPTPYAAAVDAYLAAGWDTVFPLPVREKDPPPTGYTGEHAMVPRPEQVEAWRATRAAGNIGGRVPDGIIGIDVDAYGKHRGAETLAELEAKLGPLPAMLDRTTSRGPDNPSGIRLAGVPTGRRWKSEAGPGIQIVQRGYRYVVLPPSIHPTAARYQRIGPQGKVHDLVKPLDNVPSLSSAWVEYLIDDSARERNGKAKLSSDELRELLAGMPTDAGRLCPAVSERLRRALVDFGGEQGSRHDAMIRHVLDLVRLGEQGHTGAPEALETARAAFVTAVEADRSRGEREADAEFTRALKGTDGRKGALAIVAAKPTAAADKGCCGSRLVVDVPEDPPLCMEVDEPEPARSDEPEAEAEPKAEARSAPSTSDDIPSPAEFWEARAGLADLLTFARSRRLGPWATLASVLAHVSTRIGPHVVLPSQVGYYASLSLLVGLVSTSGGGKSTAILAGREFVGSPSELLIPRHDLGTGQGIDSAYTETVKRKGQPPQSIQHCDSCLFTATEISQVRAHAGQQGSTLMSTLKKAWGGEALGGRYADVTKRRPVPEHYYRFALIAGIQPSESGVLFNDTDGGTPQRWLWLPTNDPDAPPDAPEPPMYLGWAPPGDFQPKGELLFDGVEPGEFAIKAWKVLDVCPDAFQATDEQRIEQLKRGVTDETDLDAHALLLRRKVAALLDLLDGRSEVTTEGWQLAGTVMQISTETREACRKVVDRKRRAAARAKGHEDSERMEVVENRHEERVARRVLRLLKERDNWTAHNELRKALASRDRHVFEVAVGRLIKAGLVERVEADNEGPQGWKYRAR